ncbi:MAG: type IV secretion system DNA-binding domain-containing protein [Patescibacteria group bacterium]|jgi:hypothetical protein
MDGHEVEDKPAKLVKPTEEAPPEINFFGATNFRNQNRKFGIKIDDRRRHMYVVGKTGMGKTTLLENMVLNDIYAGHGIGLVDPHGDFAEKIINYIPANRINDVVYFNPADIDFPIGFNILETVRPEQKHLVASGLMGVFKKIWPDVWSARMEYILNNTILALLDFPGTTLLGINRMLADEEYRVRVVNNSKDPVVKAFWQTEFDSYNDRYKQEAVAPIQNKIGQFLSASVIRNIVAQVKSRIDIRDIMDNKKIFIMNLSKGRIGEDNSRLLGGMLITRLQLAAMERVDILEKDRKDFFLYVDEFQNFATESFANILSEARKYRLDLIMAHQYMEQLDEKVLAAVIGNVGTTVTFRVGSTDAEILAKEFVPTFVEEDLVNLPKFQIYLKLMIDGVASKPFSAMTLAPIAKKTDSHEKVVRVSRERYAVPKEKIEDKIMRWSGMGAHDALETDVEVDVAGATLASSPQAPKPNSPPPSKPAYQGNKKGGKGNSQNKNTGSWGGKKDQKNFNGKPHPEKNPSNQSPMKELSKMNPATQPAEKVFLVDPNQKGITLSEAMGIVKVEKKANPATATIAEFIQAKKFTEQPKPELKPATQVQQAPKPPLKPLMANLSDKNFVLPKAETKPEFKSPIVEKTSVIPPPITQPPNSQSTSKSTETPLKPKKIEPGQVEKIN